MLENIESRAAVFEARSARFKQLRNQYRSFLTRIEHESKVKEKEAVLPLSTTLNKFIDSHHPKTTRVEIRETSKPFWMHDLGNADHLQARPMIERNSMRGDFNATPAKRQSVAVEDDTDDSNTSVIAAHTDHQFNAEMNSKKSNFSSEECLNMEDYIHPVKEILNSNDIMQNVDENQNSLPGITLKQENELEVFEDGKANEISPLKMGMNETVNQDCEEIITDTDKILSPPEILQLDLHENSAPEITHDNEEIISAGLDQVQLNAQVNDEIEASTALEHIENIPNHDQYQYYEETDNHKQGAEGEEYSENVLPQAFNCQTLEEQNVDLGSLSQPPAEQHFEEPTTDNMQYGESDQAIAYDDQNRQVYYDENGQQMHYDEATQEYKYTEQQYDENDQNYQYDTNMGGEMADYPQDQAATGDPIENVYYDDGNNEEAEYAGPELVTQQLYNSEGAGTIGDIETVATSPQANLLELLDTESESTPHPQGEQKEATESDFEFSATSDAANLPQS